MPRKADISRPSAEAIDDRNEPVPLMEPLRLADESRARGEAADLAFELAQRSATLGGSLPPQALGALAALVRSMNCYYSNLIEGHQTHPVEIERALAAEFSGDSRKRDLQLEARAHVAVQRWIDEGGLAGSREVTAAGVREAHRRFCELLPEDLLSVEDPQTGEKLRLDPGEFRRRFVKVGQHVPVSPGAVPRFLERYEEVYRPMNRMEAVVSLAAAHHRLVWIHPFLDGNGRVARLISHARLLSALNTAGVWSIARGLARSVNDYKRLLSGCDQRRWDDLDGRGNLSERALAEFTLYFLRSCIDQVDFMAALMSPQTLRERMQAWAREEARAGRLPPKADLVLRELLYRGELPRGEAPAVVGTGDRQARRIVSALIECGAVQSASSRADLRLAFPAKLASRWLPGLFPDYPG